MRKISVIGASLLLLALGSCSREKDITPADGFVKMRFTAVVGDTRTAYENDKTASWVAGDAISVYVTNGTDGQVVTSRATCPPGTRPSSPAPIRPMPPIPSTPPV